MMPLRFSVLLVLLAAGCEAAPGAARPAADSRPGRLAILATTGMIADAARNIGGDLVHVTSLMGPGVDPHLYQPTARDQGKLKAAQLVLYNGLHLEGKMADVLESLARQKRVVAVSREIPASQLLSSRDSVGMHDPHVWFDVKLWRICARTIVRACSEADPLHASEYEQRAARYLAELDRLEDDCRALAATLPAERRVLITSHDAFHYFGRAYGFEVVGIQGISTDSEAGLKAITDAVDFIRQRHVRAIFPETSVPRAAIERVARDGGAQLAPELYSDSLGAPDSPAGTYTGMIRSNMQNIVTALQDHPSQATPQP